jgi:hypothetical protein
MPAKAAPVWTIDSPRRLTALRILAGTRHTFVIVAAVLICLASLRAPTRDA